jgi:PKD repeat protein
MKNLYCLSLLFFLLVAQAARGQLSGNYTVGDSTCTFITIQNAIDSLLQVGTAGDVRFIIKPGNYDSFSLSGYQPSHASDTVTFQSQSGRTGDVIITGEIRVINSAQVVFRYLQFEPYSGQQTSCVGLLDSDKIDFYFCVFINYDPNCFTTDEALFSVSFPLTGSTQSTNVIQCTLSSPNYTIYFYGAKGEVLFLKDTISGAIDWFASGTKTFYTANVFNLSPIYMDFPDQTFRENIFNGGPLIMEGDFYFNTFNCITYLSATRVYNNHFYFPCNVLSSEMASILNNIFEQYFMMTYSNNSTIAYNRFLNNAIFSGDDGASVTGNFCYDSTEFDQGGGYMIRNNNYSPNAFLEMWYTSGTIENNNISNIMIWQPQLTTISNNNYIPNGSSNVSTYGLYPFFYNPGYRSSTDLHATNPALIRKSTPLDATNGIRYDIDSIPRKTIPTIGANEICFSFQYDTILLNCDSLCLDLCTDTTGGFYWSPSSLFKDSVSYSPVIHPWTACWVRLNKRGTGVIDSAYIYEVVSKPVAAASAVDNDLIVHFLNLSICADSVLWVFGDGTTGTGNDFYHSYPGYGIYPCMLYVSNLLGKDSLSLPLFITCLPASTITVNCGDSIRLESCITNFTGYYWSPSYLFKDSSEVNPVIYPDFSENIYLNNINSPGFASLTIIVNPEVPKASLSYSIDSLNVSFTDKTMCADDVLWDFGDGTVSTSNNPIHRYPTKDLYHGKLYAFSEGGSDTAFFTINLTGIGQLAMPRFTLWPNPASNFLVIEPDTRVQEYSVFITDLYGRIVLNFPRIRNRNQLDINSLSPGIYLVRIQTDGISFIQKIIVR